MSRLPFNPMQTMGGMMGGNPLGMILQAALGGGNPMQMMQQLAGQNPQMAQAMRMIQGKSPQQLQQMAENMARERGMSLGDLAKQFGLNVPQK